MQTPCRMDTIIGPEPALPPRSYLSGDFAIEVHSGIREARRMLDSMPVNGETDEAVRRSDNWRRADRSGAGALADQTGRRGTYYRQDRRAGNDLSCLGRAGADARTLPAARSNG